MTKAIVVAGASGRMGKAIIRIIAGGDSCKLGGACESPHCPVLGADAGLNAGVQALGVAISNDLPAILKNVKSVLIDFTTVESTLVNLANAVAAGIPVVIGTTGFDKQQKQQIAEAAKKIPIVMAPNMSVGVNTLFKIVGDVARIMGENYDIEIFEAHHNKKMDAPSGTAMGLADKICQATGRDFPGDLVLRNMGVIGKRTKKEIGMQVMRGGDIVGEHTVFYCGEGERVEIKHVATDRATFAGGAVRAAVWLHDQKAPGLYDMQDVLGLK